MSLLVACGLEQEAAIIRQACPKALVVVGAGDAALLTSRLDAALGQDAIKIDRVISAGICGGLNPTLQAGDVVVGVNADLWGAVVTCDLPWSDRLFNGLNAAWGRFAWSASAVARLSDKAALRASTGADCVDEETGIAGSIAASKGLPFAVLRIVCDPASFELPPAGSVKLTAIGALDMGAILRSIAGDIWQLPSLVELAAYSATAMGSLKAALARVGPDFGA